MIFLPAQEEDLRRINLQKCPQIELPLDGVRLSDNNPKVHPERQLAMLEASFRRFRHISPILVAKDGEVIAGHARVTVARRLGLSSVPAIILPHLNEAEKRAYRIADNAIAEKGQWSIELLTSELELLTAVDLGFDPIEIGFETGEVDSLIMGARAQPITPPAAEPDRSTQAVARLGDIFDIGPHVVGCGDSKCSATFAAVLRGRKAQAVISDQPWNLAASFISGKGHIRHRDFVECAGELSPAEFEAFTDAVVANQAAHCAPGALVFQFIDWRSVDVMIAAGKRRVGELVNICVWVKQSGRMGSPWRSQHELVCVFRAPGGKSRDNVKLGVYGRNRTNVWRYDAPSAFGSQRDKLRLHPTCKNESMIADAILDCTDRKDLVLDAFLGSGTTILAAHMAGRAGVGIELDPHYVDLAVSRIAEATGEEPRHQSGKTFKELAEERSNDVEG